MGRPKKVIEPGTQFRHLTVVREDGRIGNNVAYLCKCDGQHETSDERLVRVTGSDLLRGTAVSCGCARKIQVRPGDVYGYATVLRMLGTDGKRTMFECRCDGTHPDGQPRSFTASGSHLKSGSVVSCGCRREELKRSIKTHVIKTHGLSKHPLYCTWSSMMRRCYNPKDAAFPNYGGRGITVCDTWHDIATFIADMYPSHQEGHTLDRRDNDGHYEPSNCRWATPATQNNNQRSNIIVTINGHSTTVAKAARRSGINPQTAYARIRAGWSLEEATTLPALRRPT
jgi:hypothetical protein